MGLLVIIVIIIGHWLADFIFQPTKSILEKGYQFIDILKHVLEYTISMTLLIFILILFNILQTTSLYFVISFFIFTFFTHLIVDFITSKLIINLNNNDKNDFKLNYFSLNITDQMIHLISLFLTIDFLFY